jgi:predicted esterase
MSCRGDIDRPPAAGIRSRLRQRAPILLPLALLVLGCAGTRSTGPTNSSVLDGLASRGVALDDLLAPPSGAELARVRAEWSARDVGALDVREEARFALPDDQVLLVISHRTPAGRHFGAVLAPLTALAEDATRPVLLQLHGLGPKLTLEVPDPAAAPPGTPPTEIITVWPSFAGHQLRFRDQTWSSDGDPWDFCDGAGDDALRFLGAVREIVPAADPRRVVAFGGSRGGNVALLLALRDPRVRRAVSLAGPTDFFVEELVSHENAFVLYAQWLLRPSLDGTGSVADSRARLLRCSPRYFAADLPAVQLHHGTADRNLPDGQTRALEQTLRTLRRTSDEIYYYEGADHELEGYQPVLRDRVRAFLAPVFTGE